ncbi:MAG: N-acetyltransferase [Candidatus Abyssubacteria bacterium]
MNNFVRKAKMADVSAIRDLILHYSRTGDLLPKPLMEIYEDLRDFFVYVNGDDHVIGCCALHLFWDDLAEIRSLAVGQNDERKGIGSALVGACLEDAQAIGIRKVFTLTNKPAFFEKLGFERIDRSQLPHKIWAACVRCVKFPDCDEIALIRILEQ